MRDKAPWLTLGPKTGEDGMHIRGKITAWEPDKGSGFITPSTGAKQVWVHYTGFVDRTSPPQIGQMVTFLLHTDDEGKPCAEGVMRDGDKPLEARIGEKQPWSLGKIVLFVLVLVVAGVLAYMKYHQEPAESPAVIAIPSGTPPQVKQPDSQ